MLNAEQGHNMTKAQFRQIVNSLINDGHCLSFHAYGIMGQSIVLPPSHHPKGEGHQLQWNQWNLTFDGSNKSGGTVWGDRAGTVEIIFLHDAWYANFN